MDDWEVMISTRVRSGAGVNGIERLFDFYIQNRNMDWMEGVDRLITNSLWDFPQKIHRFFLDRE